jgi:hypothetical protein
MKINFTKKEYRLLLDMMYLSDWMINSHSIPPEIASSAHKEFKNKIYSFCKEMDAEDLIEYVEKHNEYYETRKFDDIISDKFIEPYNNDIFWEELTDRLAERDLINELGIDKMSTLDGIERITLLERKKEKYINEFEENGLENLEINSK